MKCGNFICPLQKEFISDMTCGLGIKPRNCEARKRYNRTIAPLLQVWNALRSAIFHLITIHKYDGLKPLYKIIEKIDQERNKYYGRKA